MGYYKTSSVQSCRSQNGLRKSRSSTPSWTKSKRTVETTLALAKEKKKDFQVYKHDERTQHETKLVRWTTAARSTNNSAEVSKNLDRYDSENNCLDHTHRNNYVKNSEAWGMLAISFDILAISLSVLHNYFDDFNKIIFRSVSN